MDELRTKIKKRIEIMGVKKGHVAKQADISISHFSHFLSGRVPLNDLQIKQITNYLGL